MEIATYPEKFSDNLTVEISTEAEDHCIIVLSSEKGQVVRVRGVNVNQGKNQIQIDSVHSLEAGIYQISVKNTKSNILFSSMLTKF